MPGVVENAEVRSLLSELTTDVGRADPYPRYDRLREIAAVVRAEDGTLVVTRHADCLVVTRDPRLRHQPPEQRLRAFPLIEDWTAHPALRLLFNSMLLSNPPQHTRLRGLVRGAFTIRRVRALRPAIVRMVDELLDGMMGQVDFMRAFAFRLPVNVVGELLGVPAADRERLPPLVRQWSQVIEVITPEVLSRADSAASAIGEYFSGLIAERRRKPTGDLTSTLAAAAQAGDKLSEDELLNSVGFLLGAGLEAMTNLLGNGLAALMQHPDQLRLLRERPDLARSAVEELLRFDSPAQIIPRSVMEPVELGGIPIAVGERVVAYVGAGNRDPGRFTAPGRLDLTRPDNAPLSLGGGIHHCLGASLARLQAEVAFTALARRFSRIELRGVPERRDSLTLRGYARLPVEVG